MIGFVFGLVVGLTAGCLFRDQIVGLVTSLLAKLKDKG